RVEREKGGKKRAQGLLCPRPSPRRKWPALASAGKARLIGAVAQLGERLVRNEEVRGSTPLGSTRETKDLEGPCGGLCHLGRQLRRQIGNGHMTRASHASCVRELMQSSAAHDKAHLRCNKSRKQSARSNCARVRSRATGGPENCALAKLNFTFLAAQAGICLLSPFFLVDSCTMPTLKNSRRETFARLLASGKTATDAYEEAGYKRSHSNGPALAKT